MSTALVTGVAGQDGVLLARRLLAEGNQVVGTVRPGSPSAARMAPYLTGVTLQEHDLRDAEGFARLLAVYRPDEVYNLAGFSSVGRSWEQPALTAETNAGAVEMMLRAVAGAGGRVRFFQASSAEQLGAAAHSPYAAAKAAAHEVVTKARDAGLHASAGILFAHESPLRGEQFVTRKITRAVAAIARGRQQELRLGNLEVSRDWGSAAEYVEAMRLLLQQDEPGDLMIATGVTTSLRDLVSRAFAAAGLDADQHVVHDPGLVRPADAPVLVGDTSAAAERLGWRARTTVEEVVERMVRADLQRLDSGIDEAPSYLS